MVKKSIVIGVKMFGKQDILIVCALEIETRGHLEGYNVLYTGVGKINATFGLSNYLSICDKTTLPKLVINYGTAGSRDLSIGELVDCKKFIQRDMDATQFGFDRGQTPYEDDVPIMLEFQNVDFNPVNKHYRGWGFICGSGDNFVDKIEDEIEYVDVFDMEAYALAKVCSYYYVSFISFKYITDNANEHSVGDWKDNLGKGIVQFKERILDLLPESEER